MLRFGFFIGLLFLAPLLMGQLVGVSHEIVYTDGDDPLATDYPVGFKTYRIYGHLAPGNNSLTTVFAEDGMNLLLGSDSEDIWNSALGGISGDELIAAFFPVFPESEWDSFVTIGRTHAADGLSGEVNVVSNSPSILTIENTFGFPGFGLDLDLEDGVWFVTPDATAAMGQGPANSVLLAQVTCSGDIEYRLNLQVHTGDDPVIPIVNYLWDQSDVDEDNEAWLEGLSYPQGCIPGCTHPDACNYNATAVCDDGSCVMAYGCDVCSGDDDGTGVLIDNPEPGELCDDGDPSTINDTVQADCSCQGEICVTGCTDPNSCNYNASTNCEDGSCDGGPTGCDVCSGELDGTGVIMDNPEIGEVCDDGNPETFNDTIQPDCSCQGEALVWGCGIWEACNYDPAVNADDGSCYYPGESCDDGDPLTINDTVQADCSCQGEPGPPPVADIDGDGFVGTSDLLLLIGEFGCTSGCAYDLDGDGVVSTGDILFLLGFFGFGSL